MPDHVAPDIRNYYIGKGTVEFMRDGESAYRLLGNVPVLEFTPTIDTLPHYSSQEGTKTKDRTVVLAKSGTIKLTLDEWNAENFAMALLGTVTINSALEEEIQIFSENAVSGKLKFTGTNEVGPKWEMIFNKVDFIPSSAINPISEEYGQLEISGEAAAVAGSFGTARRIGGEA